jgi:GT2 family glycosyltransferase
MARVIQDILGISNSFRSEACLFAVERALRLIEKGQFDPTVETLEYALRLAPMDTAIIFVLGHLKLAIQRSDAIGLLERVAHDTGHRDAIISVAKAYHTFGDFGRAVGELQKALCSNAPPQDLAFQMLANNITEQAGAEGWCGLSNSGRLTIGGDTASSKSTKLEVFIDGQLARLKTVKSNEVQGIQHFKLPESWRMARQIAVFAGGSELIGSPIFVDKVARIEGLATVSGGGVGGWCWHPGEPERPLRITLTSQFEPIKTLTVKAEISIRWTSNFSIFFAPRRFFAPCEMLAGFDGLVQVFGPHMQALYGSPLSPRGPIENAVNAVIDVKNFFSVDPLSSDGPAGDIKHIGICKEPSIPVNLLMPKSMRPLPLGGRTVNIIIPVFRGLNATKACIESVLTARSLDERLIVVVDASPDQDMIAYLKLLASSGAIELQLESVNRGFPVTANIGLRLTNDADVVVLNSDTLVAPGWLQALQAAAYSEHDIGTATPLSNNATIFSYPCADQFNPPPDFSEIVYLNRIASEVNAGLTIDVPTGHGFCLYIRSECLRETGIFREDVFGQGYGEENDFCMRAKVFGWRHVAVPSVFVGHLESQSFSDVKSQLIARNIEVLNRLHVGYDNLINVWLSGDPLFASRRRLDMERFLREVAKRHAIMLITHNRKGGTSRHVAERVLFHDGRGDCAITIHSSLASAGRHKCRVRAGHTVDFPNLEFQLPDEFDLLLDFLARVRIRFVEFHHFIGHHPSIFKLANCLGSYYDVFIHDYAWFCPRITLTNTRTGYCGEPAVSQCVYCVDDNGSNIEEDTNPIDLIARSTAFLEAARSVIAPSFDTAARIRRHFPIEVKVEMWEREFRLKVACQIFGSESIRRICVVGAIGFEKGYDQLLACARSIAQKSLPVKICLVGYSSDDRRLLETGCVKITGPFEEHEVLELITTQQCDFGFLPTIWPETWSYALSHLWQANLPVVAYNIGAPAERIRSMNGGLLVPLHLSAERLVDLFLQRDLFVNDRSFC